MIKKLTIAEAKAQGYKVDTTCYPHFAYKGPRFAPTAFTPVLTESEAELVMGLQGIAMSHPTTEEGETLASMAREALTAAGAA